MATLTIVIPVARSIDFLNDQVNALRPQLAGFKNRYLNLACNDSSLIKSIEMLDLVHTLSQAGVNVKLLDATEKKGAPYARNVGWQNSNTELVLFCDDDDVAHPNWVEEMEKALSGFDMVGGRLEFFDLNSAHLSKIYRYSQERLPVKFHHLPFSPTCNLGVKKQVLLQSGGFNEDLKNGEDIDFCWRAQYDGFNLGFAQAATVSYRLRPSNRLVYKQFKIYGVSDGPLMTIHKRRGASRKVTATIYEIASLVYSLVFAFSSQTNQYKAAQRLGAFVGRLKATLICRVWVL